MNLRDNEIVELYKTSSIEYISTKIGLCRKTISKILKKHSIQFRSRSETNAITRTQHPRIPWDTTEDRDKLVIELYVSGIGSHTTGRILSISKRTVLRILKLNNIDTTRSQSFYSKKIDIKTAIKEYDSGKSVDEISKNLNVCSETLRTRISEHTSIRSPGDTMRGFAGLEQEVADMYENGYSTYDVAEYYNINNPDTIAKYLKKIGKLRNREEVRKLVAIKMSKNGGIFRSKPQKAFATILDSMAIQYIEEFPLDGWNFDFKLSDTVLIDINGDYWHRLPDRIARDKRKKMVAKQHGYELLWVWEHQLERKEFIKNYINNMINHKNEEFSFGDVDICINHQSVKEFIQSNHYSGKCPRVKFSTAAILNGEIIGGIAFSTVLRLETAKKQGVHHSKILELSRMVIHTNFHKRNFASWLISKSIKLLKQNIPNITMLVSFADSTYNHSGIIYKASGWAFNGMVKTDYWYVSPKRSIVHKRTMWGRAKQASMSEDGYRLEHKFTKVWGHEKHRYIKSI